MITTGHLEDVSYQLSKASNLYAALRLAVDALGVDDPVQVRDAIIGVTEVLGIQLENSHAALEKLFKIAPFADKSEAA
ncbi:hypothetical protein [Paracoccus ravus]|uniref:hypothetical protein n=1 Tax=Paracoccus ravus TaxID=2447760 RepID=UPI00106DF3F1|nr:hypothetical protein [Paracoccus ravus]